MKRKAAGETADQTLGAHGTPEGRGLARRCSQLVQAGCPLLLGWRRGSAQPA